MKVALINPKNRLVYSKLGDPSYSSNTVLENFYRSSPDIQSVKGVTFTPNPALPLLSTMTGEDDEIVHIDENIEDINFEEKFDLVAITAMTQQAERAYEIASEFRKRGVYTVMGGVHASLLPDEASLYVDSVVIGESELLWPLFIKDYKNKAPKPIYKLIDNAKYNLTESPLPSYSIIKMDKYKIYPIQISRGCPHQCEFCVVSELYGHAPRHKSIEQILREIDSLKSLSARRRINIFFCDDNIFLDKVFIKELLHKIIPLKIKWASQCDVSIAKYPEILELARESGCFQLLIGFESIDKKSLGHDTWKAKQVDTYASSIKEIQSNGIAVWGSFIFGNDEDNKDIFQKTLDFIMETGLFSALFNILTPLPGSRLYKRLEREGRLFKKRFWDQCTFYDILFEPQNMTKEELIEGFNWLFFEYYKPDNQKRIRNYFKELLAQNLAREKRDNLE